MLIMFIFAQSVKAAKINHPPLPDEDSRAYISELNPQGINLELKQKAKQKIQLNKPVQELNNELFTSKEDILKHYLQAQKKLDIEDIKSLWESTVKRNSVIKFALKKLSLPAEQRKVSSSRMAKTVASLINGACMLPALLGAGSITSSAASTGGSFASRAILNKNLPKEMPLTDTELIQLVRLVEELQDKVIKNYYAYKGNLEAYKTAKENIVEHNKTYSQAIETGDLTQILTSKALYDRAIRTEEELRQKIKINRLLLERLAGVEVINNLNLGKIALFDDLEKLNNISENEVKVKNIKAPKLEGKVGKIDYSAADVKTLSREINIELEEEKKDILPDLQILWAAAVEKSETIRFAILKLSNPQGEVEKSNAVKKLLSPIASVAPIVGLGFTDPVTAGSTMFGGGLLNSLLSDDSRLNTKLTKVTDADLVMLAQETDSLQEKLVILYYDYLNSLIELNSIDKKVIENKKYLNITQKSNPGLTCIANVFYEEAVSSKFKTRQKVLEKRVALEQFVGNDALLVVDKNIKDRLPHQS